MMKHFSICEMPKSFHLLALSFALPFFAAGCGQQETSLYPLAPGLSWEYQISAKKMLGGGQAAMTVTNLPPRQLGGRDVVPQKMEALGRSAFTFIAQDNTGIYEHASQEDGEPEIKKTPVYLLKYPVQVGTSWDDASKTELLQEKIPVTIKSTIESVTEAVTVPAGTFNNCVKVRGVGKAKKSMGLFGVAKIDVESATWMCPGIGVVKSFKEEDGHNLLLGGGKASMQLASMRKDGKPVSGQTSGFAFPDWFGGQAKTAPFASPRAAGNGAGAKQYLDSLFDRIFFPDGMKYTLTALGTLGGMESKANALSADGTIVVGASETSDGLTHAFRWKDGVMIDLGTLGEGFSQASAVSDDGKLVVGSNDIGEEMSRAFRWEDGVMSDLGTLGGEANIAHSVSANRVVVGTSSLSNGLSRAFRWKDGVMTDLGTLGGNWSEARAVSVDGAVVVGQSERGAGTHYAFRWQDGVMVDLGTLGGKYSHANAVSANGTVVVGQSERSDGIYHAFRWKDGVMTDLGTLGGKTSVATAVSADGTVVVGGSQNSKGVSHAFRWQDGTMVDLGTLGGNESGATAVSADGTVVAGVSRNTANHDIAFIAAPPSVAWLPIPTARIVYYAVLSTITLSLLIVFALALRSVVRGRRAHRQAPAGEAQIYCSECGSAQLPGATFCTNCGARLEK